MLHSAPEGTQLRAWPLLQERRRREAAERRLNEQLDPEARARHFMTPRDEEIRETGEPSQPCSLEALSWHCLGSTLLPTGHT